MCTAARSVAALWALALAGSAVAAPLAPQPWWRGHVMYEVFVRSFADSDGDGIGDLRGLMGRLDTLNDGDPATHNDLGVDILWLMPIFASPSYHGYDVVDFRATAAAYGTDADFAALCAAAHARGMRVILDFPLNHVSSAHPWFRAATARNDAPERASFTFKDAPDARFVRPWDGANVWHRSAHGYFYGLFWEGMPDLNVQNPTVKQALVDAMLLWRGRGADGFRLDAVRYLVEDADGKNAETAGTHAWLQELRATVDARAPGTLLVGEVWASDDIIAQYVDRPQTPPELPLLYSFNVAGGILAAVNDGTRAPLLAALKNAAEAFPDAAAQAPFLANHDMPRSLRQLGGNTDAARLAMATLMALPGTPVIWQGEELGMQGGAGPADENKRTPYRWAPGAGFGFSAPPPSGGASALPWFDVSELPGVDLQTERADPLSLWSTTRDLVALRHAHRALTEGGLTVLDVKAPDARARRGAVALLRAASKGQERVVVLANYAPNASGPFVVDLNKAPRDVGLSVLWATGATGVLSWTERGLAVSNLPARSAAFVVLRAHPTAENAR